MVLSPGTRIEKPSKVSMGMPLLYTICASIKLWVAPLSTNTKTRFPCIVHLILNVKYLGTPHNEANTPPAGAKGAPSSGGGGGGPPGPPDP